MYVIVTYDFDAKRTHKPRKFLRQYLIHVQNSVFEGQVTKGELDTITNKLESMTTTGETATVYSVTTESHVTRDTFGNDPAEERKFI